MKQVFYSGPVSIGDFVELDEAVAHHLFDVLRTTSSERVRLISEGKVYLVRTAQKPQVEILELLEEKPDNQPDLTLCFALIKADRFEWMLQKAAELGVSRIVPFSCARTVVQIEPKKEEKKRARWMSILEQACRQSNRRDVPILEPVCSIKDLAAWKADVSVCAYEKENETHILYDVLKKEWQSASFVIGPEGGFTPQEADQLEEQGFALCTLGHNILRAETAACFVLSAAQYQFQASLQNVSNGQEGAGIQE